MLTRTKFTFKPVVISSLAALGLLLSANAPAKIYKWVDDKGQTHYTSTPPAQRDKAKNIESEIKAKAGKGKEPEPEEEKNETADSQTDDATKTDDEEEEKLSGPDEELQKYCDGNRSNLELLRKNYRTRWTNEKGEKEILTQEQRRNKVKELKQKLQDDCAEVPPLKSKKES